jgi:hypothetical protein
MADFLLEPDEIESARPERARPVRLVHTGIAPTAAVPKSKRGTPDPAPAYVPCPACGACVLVGHQATGAAVALDVQRRCYTVLWLPGAARPRLDESRAYPVHQCRLTDGTPEVCTR